MRDIQNRKEDIVISVSPISTNTVPAIIALNNIVVYTGHCTGSTINI